MGPKRPAIASAPASNSRELAVARTRRKSSDEEDLSRALVPHSGQRIINPLTTSKALILRAKETGGELILARNITGPEKLRLKAEALAGALKEPFNLDELVKIADSQYQQHLTIIDRLQDPDFFFDDMTDSINGRIEAFSKTNPLSSPAFVASAIGSRVHNVYYIAGTWKQVILLLNELKATSPFIQPSDLPNLLKKDPKYRDKYILLYRVMAMLVTVTQKKLSLAAAAAPHYAHYFEKRTSGENSSFMSFRRSQAMGPMKSLMDTIIMELVFPDSEYPLHVLYACLKDTIDGYPKETKRFTQQLYDSVGDLAATVRFLEMLENPLAGPQGEVWRNTVPPYTEDFDAYLDAEWFSIKASKDNARWREHVNPLTKTKDPNVLQSLWKDINLSYTQASGFNVDRTWQLQDDRRPTPQWSYQYDRSLFDLDDIESDYTDYDTDEEGQNSRAIVLHKKKKSAKHKSSTKALMRPKIGRTGKKLAITGGETGALSDDDDVPDLLSPSESSDEENDDDSDSGEDFDDLEDNNSEYDSEEEEELKRMFNQVMDAGEEAIPELIQTWAEGASASKSPQSAKKAKNPFVKLLGRLAGRMFSLDPTLNSRREFGPVPPPASTSTKTAPPPPKKPETSVNGNVPPKPKPERPMPGLQAPSSDNEMPRLVPNIPRENVRSQKATVEEVEDEEEAADKAKKKKKKKKKPAKKNKGENAEMDEAPASPTPAAATPVSSPPPATQKPTTAKPTAPSSTYLNPFASYSSLSLHHPAGQSAQSARSYLAEKGISFGKDKKDRGRSEPSAVVVPDKEGFWKKLSRKNKKAEEIDEEEDFDGAPSFTPQNPPLPKFSIRKRAGKLMHRLFSTDEEQSPMKWDHFVKALQNMGFTYHPDTAGSSVRFDPPSSQDRPITFHKPHPDSTIPYKMLLGFRKRLAKHYGWTEAQFIDFDDSPAVEID